MTSAVDSRLEGLIARARAFDGHPPFSDGALAELATGKREVVWLEGDVGAAVRTVASAASASVAEALEGTGAPTTEAEFVIDPDARRQGHGRALLHRLLVDAPGEVLIWAHGGHPAARHLAASHGLEPVRELLHLTGDVPGDRSEAGDRARRDLPTSNLGEISTSSISGGSISDHVDELLAVNARAFAEHPEQGRMTRAEFDALSADPWFDPEDVLLAYDGERLVGICWLKVEGVGGASSASATGTSGTGTSGTGASGAGEFYVVGVDPAAQGQGWGRRLVEAGLARLASRGIHHAHLYVEADNAPALRLYREFGFREHSVDVQFRWRSEPSDDRPEQPSDQLIRSSRDGGSMSSMESSDTLADASAATDSLDEYDLDESSSFDDGTLPHERYLDRELSWLAFNQRVLELAEDDNLPLIERANFLAIFASNLDEFFMVRVAGLKRRIATGLAVPTNIGTPPAQVFAEVSAKAHELQERHSRVFHDLVKPALDDAGIHIETWADLGFADRERVDEIFSQQIFPVLMPLAVDPAHPFPYISGLSLNLSIRVRNPKTEREEFARLKVPPNLPRFVQLPDDGSGRLRYIPLEDLISNHLGDLFPGMEILEHHEFRVTRNEDVEVDEDESENLIQALEKQILNRRFGPPIRLEITDDMDPVTLDLLVRELAITEQEVYRLPAPLDLGGLFQLTRIDRPALKYPRHVPSTSVHLLPVEPNAAPDIFASIAKQDVLVHHPYESFATSVQAFLEQAATDPHVLAIKQTLYRTSGDSPIVEALIAAAEAGKSVLALVEIKARFDETANISWARKLEKAGVHVVYGLVGLKTHCKAALVIRQEDGVLRHYSHIGTGNYNPKTSRIYEDLGLFTADDQVGKDLTRLFNELSGYAIEKKFKRLLVAPLHLRNGLLKRINAEAANAREGLPSGIRIKLNSIVDEAIIDALYHASNAGVPIDLVVRGICGLKPGQPGVSENIRVRSILGRYLEHARIFSFHNNGDPQVYIGSADMMHRNLDRRVEALVRLSAPEHLTELDELFDLAMSDATASWWLDSDGNWTRHNRAEDGTPLQDMQNVLMRQISQRKRGGAIR